MNSSIVFLTLAVLCIGYVHSANYCYYCADCPNPFTPNDSRVRIVQTPTTFCAKKSRSTDPYAPSSRGAAEPGLCVVTGCRFVPDSPTTSIYVCCCNNGDYCNGSM